jgi:hypothetical protein
MKAFFTLVLILVVALGVYNYLNNHLLSIHFTDDLPEHITIEGDSVTVDAGDYDVRFEALKEFQKTYMLFGGSYYKDKIPINPIWLAGLGIVDAKNIYARYPDFHRCESPGAALAQRKLKRLNLIPADKQALFELRKSIKEHKDNVGQDGDRVCVSLVGKTLFLKSAKVPQMHMDSNGKLYTPTYHLISSSKRINCRNLLDPA